MASAQAPPRPLETSIPIENDRQVAILVTSAFAIAVPTILVALRFWARRIVGRSLDASDLCMFAALIFTIGLHADMYVMCLLGGFGFHGTEIIVRFGMDTLELFLKGIFAFPIIWSITICLSKLSVLLMYANVIAVPKMIMACRIVGVIIVLWNTGSILGILLICRPIALNWDLTLPGTCGDVRLYYLWLGGINVVAEAMILLLPVPFLYRLQMKTYKKLVAIGLFSIGWMTCAVSIYRQASLPYLHFEDMTYTGVLATIFTGVEPSIALSLACVPFLRPLIRRNNPSTGSDSPYGSRNLRGKGTSGTADRPFKELNDDSSEIQLRPLGSDSLKYEAEVSPGHKQPTDSSGTILVKKGWNVVSGSRPAS
ncbi:hypothetical protein C8A01DRAFT_20849 [Parachaetomium inaequale]|uniref:Rhodopsin domain-containing protein n=1 Tax=Parachaetomium inaequale TaxID=2588326 RepID=A0AAN6P7X8_9PEZI|nr:hypothetical protein C8A01DRAFT_20849 [Parachaetomium inaequale]